MAIVPVKDTPVTIITISQNERDKKIYFKDEIERLNALLSKYEYLMRELSIKCPQIQKEINILECSMRIKNMNCIKSCFERNNCLFKLLAQSIK